MADLSESVHVHRSDAALIIEEYRLKGYVVKEQTKPTVIAQRGFVKLIFVPIGEDLRQPAVEEPPGEPKRRAFFSF